MCGIGFWYGEKISSYAKDFKLYMNSIIHRGPDHQAVLSIGSNVIIGNNRLSIIDQHIRSNQPFQYKDLFLTFNGAIYNFKEIKSDLVTLGHEFITEGDTEVILHAYDEYGMDAIPLFEGMWAFVIFDAKKKEIIASRDRFGIKPLYYASNNSSLYIGSEVKQFMFTPEKYEQIDSTMVKYYLESGGFSNYNENSFIEGVKQLLPATNLIYKVESNNMEFQSYYSLEKSTSEDGDLKNLIIDSIKKRTIADIKPAMMFSGGLDSSIILYHVLKDNPLTSSFSFIDKADKRFDETPFIDAFISKYPHHNFNTEFLDGIDGLINECIYYQDEPPASLSAMAQFSLYKKAKQNKEKLIFSGQGADEIFGGYPRNLTLVSFKNVLMNPIESLLIIFENLDLIRTKVLNKTSTKNSLFSSKGFSFPKIDTVQEYMLYLMKSNGLRDLLHYEDRNSMSQGIETRLPFLDKELVEFAYHLSNSEKLSKMKRKGVLLELYKDMLPDEILNRRKKLAFSVPEESLLNDGFFSYENEYKKAKNNFPDLDWNENYSWQEENDLTVKWQVKFLNNYVEVNKEKRRDLIPRT